MSAPIRPRWKDYAQALWCAVFDLLSVGQCLYRSDKRGPGVWWGGVSQMIWFRAHNNRIFRWLNLGESGGYCGEPYTGPQTGDDWPRYCNKPDRHSGPHECEISAAWPSLPTENFTTNAANISTWTTTSPEVQP